LLTINKQLFLITLGSLPFYFIIILGTSKKMIILNEKEMNKNAQLNTNFIQGIQGITTIKSYKGESDFIEKISTDIDNSFKVSIERSLYDSIIQNSKNFISMITSILVLWIGSNYVIKGNITIGELITFNSLSIFFSEPIQNIIQLQEKFQKATVANNRLDDIFSIAPENDKESYSKIPENWKYIYFNNVSFYHSTKSTNGINNINIKFPINKHIGIIGKSGSGKSTLAKLIVKFYMPNKGDIFIDNVNISTLDTNSIRSEIVYIPQQSFFFSGTIRDNLYLGLDEIPEDVELFTVLDYTGLTQYIDSLPLGIDTYIEENASNLSGGQKQKLAISRALLSKSRVIILDEATSAI
ncbi:ATP-binding cassette domain-containing protein, partial [Enterococcus faecalis]|nr:ATP-binding cassette domain-containing protein [Enterococcus faecalis]